jgi:RHS repeat-associated protein
MGRWVVLFLFALPALFLLNIARAGDVTYIYSDPQGTPLAEADVQGNIKTTFDYRPYGKQVSGTAQDGPGYTGHVNDVGSGLVYMQARYYDPSFGRFISADPVAGMNIDNYTYAYNSPYNYVDPDGRDPGEDQPSCNADCHRQQDEQRRRKNDSVWGGGGLAERSAGAKKESGSQNSSSSKQSLSYAVFGGPDYGQYGIVTWTVSWVLSQASPQGGYVIQEVALTGGGVTAEKGEVFNINKKYWEAWKVSPGNTRTDLTTTGDFAFDDTFSLSTPTKSVSLTWNATARFYEGLKLPDSFTAGGSRFAGNYLPSTEIEPKLPTGAGIPSVSRVLTTNWPK